MDGAASVMDRIKGLAKSTEEFVKGAFQLRAENNSIETLKRLQRETFSELMKLRDRQDKAERFLTFYKSGKGSPFQEASTHIKGIVDVGGAILLADNIQQACNTLDRGEVRTGIDLNFIFETLIRQKDALVAEFMASQNNITYHGAVSGSPLALTKLKYMANINDSLSLISIPLGGQCQDFRICSINSQGQCLLERPFLGPSLFSQHHGCAAGIMVKGSNFVASLAELVSGLGMQPGEGVTSSLSTFGQVTYQPEEVMRFTLSGLWKMPRSPSRLIQLGKFAIPLGSLKRNRSSDLQLQASPSDLTGNTIDGISAGSLTVMLDSELDESAKFGGWVEVQNSIPRLLQWGLSLSDVPDDVLGWGLKVGRNADDHLKLEGFLNFNLGKSVNLQPGLVYIMDGHQRTPALVLRSSWLM